jgi:hypothetical protein
MPELKPLLSSKESSLLWTSFIETGCIITVGKLKGKEVMFINPPENFDHKNLLSVLSRFQTLYPRLLDIEVFYHLNYLIIQRPIS